MTLTAAPNTRTAALVDELVGELSAELPTWQTPGLQLTVVQDGAVLFAGGMGVRGLDDPTPVTSRTLFHHGSCGKAYTGLLASILAADGVLDLDAPVRQYVPELSLPDPVIAERVTTRDLLSHRSGMGRHDFAWILNPSWTRADLLARIAHLPLHGDLRAEMHYSNFGYALAGHVIERITGEDHDDVLTARVFTPLGMGRSTTSLATMGSDNDHALPHTVRDGVAERTAFRPADIVSAAGELMTCADDVARWLQVHCGAGVVGGERVLSEAAVTATHRLQVPMPPELSVHEALEVVGYTLGWVMTRFRGQTMLYHAGGVDGFRTDVLVLPGHGIGVAACANQLSTRLPFAAVMQIADRLLDPGCGSSFYDDLRVEAAAADTPPQRAGQEGSVSPSHPLPDYTGGYANSGYGDLVATVKDGALRIRLGESDLDTVHRHFDTWNVTYAPLDAELTVTFGTDAEGSVAEAVVPLEAGIEPIRFRRRDPA